MARKKARFDTRMMKSLITQLNDLQVDTAKMCQDLVQEAAEQVLRKQQIDAPKYKKEAWKKLAVTKLVKNKKGAFANVGIEAVNWAETDYLYYQHYGYEHYKSGELVDKNIGWLDNSFNSIKADIRYTFQSKLISKINSFKLKGGV